MTAQEAPHRVEVAGWIALAALAAALTITPITNNDVFLHLTTGRLILETGHVPTVDDYSALARGRPFVAHEWLAGVCFRLFERFFGLEGVIFVKPLVTIALAFALYAAARALGAGAALTLAVVGAALVIAASRVLERPHIFSYLFSAIFVMLLNRRSTGRWAPLWLFLPLQCLWANLHGGGSVLGPFLVGLAAAGRAIDALAAGAFRATDRGAASAPRPQLAEAVALAGLVLALVAVSALNPRGVSLLWFPFELTGSSFMGRIYEWQPPFGSGFQNTYSFGYYMAWTAVAGGVLAAALGIVIRCRDWPPGGAFPFLLFASFFALSLRMNRNVFDFVLVTAPGLAAIAGWLPPPPRARRWQATSAEIVSLFLIGLAGWFVQYGYAYGPNQRREFGLGIGPNIPVAAGDYLERNAVGGNAYNTYAFGAYLVYRFYPKLRVAMDSRNDVYGETLYDEHTRSLTDATALKKMLERIDASVLVLDWRDQAARTVPLLAKLPEWKLVYFDDHAVVYLQAAGPYAEVVRRDAFTFLDPSVYRAGSLSAANAEAALAEAARALRDSGGATEARLMKLEALLRLGRLEDAWAEERLLLADASSAYGSCLAVGRMLLATGHRAEAAARYQRALILEPESRPAREGLESARRDSAIAPAPPAAEAATK